MNARERKRQQRLAATRPVLDRDAFVALLGERGVDMPVARYLWEEVQPYYYAPLTPHPDDRLGSEFRVDPDDIHDIVLRFAKKFGRKLGEDWLGPDDPTLAQFAIALEASTIAP